MLALIREREEIRSNSTSLAGLLFCGSFYAFHWTRCEEFSVPTSLDKLKPHIIEDPSQKIKENRSNFYYDKKTKMLPQFGQGTSVKSDIGHAKYNNS